MTRPQNKDQLLFLSRQNFNHLNDLIDSLSEEKRGFVFPEGTMNRNIRDVLAHLYQWQKMFLEWYEIGMKGGKPEMPQKGFSWKDTPLVNQKIWADCQTINLVDIRKKLEETHHIIQNIIENHSKEELFEKRRFAWTGSTSLGSYLISSTSSHYDWAIKLIKKAIKSV